MSFTSQRANLANQLNVVHEVQGYEKAYLSSDLMSLINELRGNYILKLFIDLMQGETKIDFKAFLVDWYDFANDSAKECLLIAIDPNHLRGRRLKSWTDYSLHAFDCLLLKLIQDKLGVIIPKRSARAYESDTYEYLIQQKGDLQDIGQAFSVIYQQRNSMTHVQKSHSNGYRKIVFWSERQYSDAKKLILSQYKIALKLLEKQIVT
jgi:hypothetical protein